MRRVTIHEVKTHLSRSVDSSGWVVPDDFDEPLPDDILALFG